MSNFKNNFLKNLKSQTNAYLLLYINCCKNLKTNTDKIKVVCSNRRISWAVGGGGMQNPLLFSFRGGQRTDTSNQT